MLIETIAKYLKGYDLAITLRENPDGTVTALFVSRPNSARDKGMPIPPVSVTARPEFFDTKEFMDQFVPVLENTVNKVGNINLYTDALDKIEKKKKEDLEKKKSTSSTTSKSGKGPKVETKKETHKVPNPDYIPPEKRNADNEDYDAELYDENEPEFINKEVEVPVKPNVEQKPLI